MGPSRRVLKIAAAVCSFTLIGLYVYDRAGGNLIQKIYPGVAPESERPMMSSSKLKQMYKALENYQPNQATQEQYQNTSPKLLPGSKYTPILGTHFESKPGAPSAPLPNATAIPPGTVPQSEEPSPAESLPPKVLLHGSKSAAPLIPVPTPQDANPQVAPNGPAQKKPFQQQQSAKPTRNNSPQR
jgi:hypothetical protein